MNTTHIKKQHIYRPGPYDVVCHAGLQVKMRDGICLATDIYLPAENGQVIDKPWPTTLTRTAYDKNGFLNRAAFFASYGYFSVAQDVRGTTASEGTFVPFVNEVEDGLDCLEWILDQPYCNGKVGMYACSYMSWVQLALATQNPKGLCCLIPFGVAIDTFHHYAYPHGGLQLGLIRWVIYDVWRRAVKDNQAALDAINDKNFYQLMAELPLEKGKTFLAENSNFENVIFNYLDHKTYDDFWRQPGQGFENYFDNFPDIPMMWTSGWYDGYPKSECEGYQKLSRMGRQDNQFLLLGPWVHNQMQGNDCGDASFAPDADIDRFFTQLDFFNKHMKGMDVDIPKVRAFVMGGGSGKKTDDGKLHHGGYWWHGNDWPPPEMTTKILCLASNGSLSEAAPSAPGDNTTYTFDPDKPVPSISPPWLFPDYGPRGPADQRVPNGLVKNCIPGQKLADRDDVLVFETPPLEQDVDVLGPFTVRLFVASTAKDTDFAAKLIDVYPANDDYPEGYAYPVCEGFVRMSYRNSVTDLELMTPGQIYNIAIECFPAANKFQKGHKIRLDITSSNFPRYDINNNTGDLTSHDKVVADNTIFHNPEYQSCIYLPVISSQ